MMRPVLALAALLPLVATDARAQDVLHYPPPPPEEVACGPHKHQEPPLIVAWVLGLGGALPRWQADMDRLIQRRCGEMEALNRAAAFGHTLHAPGAQAFATAAWQDPRDLAEGYLARRMIYTNQPEIAPDGKAAEVRAMVAGQGCTVSLSRDDSQAPWRVSTFVCWQGKPQ